MNKPLKRTNMMYVNQLSFLEKNGVPTDLNELAKYIERKIKPKEYALILHDRDLKDGKPVEPHIHVALRFKSQRYLHVIAREFNDENVANVAKWDKNYKNMYSYLVHLTNGAEMSKTRYKNSEVVASFDFEELITNIMDEVFIPRKDVILELLNDYGYGNISLEDLKEELTPVEFSRNKKHIDNIKKELLVVADFESFKYEMKKENKQIENFYLFGQTGSGKSRFAKEKYADDCFVTGSNRDMFANYDSEKTVILDELRPDTITYNELLKLLDPFNYNNVVGSRYYDKRLVAERLIITTPYPPHLFYQKIKHPDGVMEVEKNSPTQVSNAAFKDPDKAEQFYRRINVLEFEKDYITPMFFNPDTLKYEALPDQRFVNRWSQEGSTFKSKEDFTQSINALFGDVENV